MWQIYRKRFIPSQIFILLVCAVVFFAKKDFRLVLYIFAAMQIFNILGALWAVRLIAKVNDAFDKKEVPLKKGK